MPRKKAKSRNRYGDYCEEIKGVLYASVQIPVGGGKYKRKRKKVANRYEAQQWALQQLDLAKHGDVTSEDLKTFHDLCEWYKTYFLVEPVYENGIKVEGSKDWKKSRAKLDRIAEHFGSKNPRSMTERDMIAYARMRRAEVTTATINRDFALLRTMFRKARAADPSIIVPVFPINTAAEVERDRVMTIAEERAILSVCGDVEALEYKRAGRKVVANHRTNRGHLYAVIILAVDTAMRSGEIFSLTWADVDLEAGTITIQKKNSKTGKERKVGITPRVGDALAAMPGGNSADRVFGIMSARKAFATACRRVGIKDLHFHDLRHTATTRMIRAKIPHAEVMKITGHTTLKTFLRYLNLEDDTVKTTADALAEYLNRQ